jgi:hypothetical protein
MFAHCVVEKAGQFVHPMVVWWRLANQEGLNLAVLQWGLQTSHLQVFRQLDWC